VGLLTLVSILVMSICTNPALPSLDLAGRNNLSLSAVNRDWQPKIDRDRLTQTQPTDELPASAAENPPAAANKSETIGFFVNWDESSLTSLKQHIHQIDKLIPEWLHLDSVDGTISIDDLHHQDRVLAYIHDYRPDLKIVPMINNYDRATQSWQQAQLVTMLANPEARQRNINSLLAFVRSHHFAGISIDFENLTPASQPNLVVYMRELHARFAGSFSECAPRRSRF
jgi:peptidoglycan-N-acetylglucosamine deacetylase